jgi:ATP-dependent DNA helicase RecG
MSLSLEQLQDLMNAREDEHLEFKAATVNFHFETLVKYCAALASEGGGKFILGVTDKMPRRVVGSRAFENLERTKAGLIERLRLRIDTIEVLHPHGRVVVVDIPARPWGCRFHIKALTGCAAAKTWCR